MEFNINKGIDIKLNAKPIYCGFYHDHVFEGPCRMGTEYMLTKEFDLEGVKQSKEMYSNLIDANLCDRVNLLESSSWNRNEEFPLTNEFIEMTPSDMANVDVYLIPPMSRMADITRTIAEITGKPIILIPPAYYPLHADIAAGMYARGQEIHVSRTWEECIEQLEILRVKKLLKNTKILCIPRFGSPDTPGAGDNLINYDTATKRFGVKFHFVNPHELMDQTHVGQCGCNPTTPKRKERNITEEEYKEIQKMSDELIAGAKGCSMTREDVIHSYRFHYVVKKMLSYYECNAFCAPCPDLCATTRLDKERYTFCMNHSLLNEEGISSACEYDLCAAISLVILSGTAKSGAYMGNTIHWPMQIKELGELQDIFFFNLDGKCNQTYKKKLMDDYENIVFTWHSVPNRKIHGFDRDPAEYSISPFTGSGWGVTLRYDFNQDVGTPVTMCRVGPSCSRMLVARGEVIAGRGEDDSGCTLGVFLRVKDGNDFFRKQMMVGNHVPLVYGDCFDKVCELGNQLGLDVLKA
ncbi:MAG: hypothetical protein PVG39_05270 [Desulfobacteraceae bacterium]